MASVNIKPLEDKILRANPAQPTKGAVGKGAPAGAGRSDAPRSGGGRPDRRPSNGGGAALRRENEPKSAFATELPKAL